MAEKVDSSKAKKVLQAALKVARTQSEVLDDAGTAIDEILKGSHKTYKYVLITGLLAKATNEKINPLALQAGANLEGAYDARSLCHKVVVPFERENLNKALGGSNEPFLNKPARFPFLSKDNAVRRGKDQETLHSLINVLSKVTSSIEANTYLCHAIRKLLIKKRELGNLQTIKINRKFSHFEITKLIPHFLNTSYEGKTLVILTGALEKLFYLKREGNWRVVVHKVNQSGASSKEVGDIDVFFDNRLDHSIEVKDKDFSVYDLEHAFDKIIKEGGTKGQLIFGNEVSFDQQSVREKLTEYERKGFIGIIDNIEDYAKMILLKTGVLKEQEFFQLIMDVAVEINAGERIQRYLKKVIQEFNDNN